jgi:DNA-binding NarL/FixJ family response regulator
VIAPRELWLDLRVASQLGLTAQQCEVLCLVASGTTNPGIGRSLGMSTERAAHRVQRLFKALAAEDRANLIALAYECGLLRTPEVRLRVQAGRGGRVTVRREVVS